MNASARPLLLIPTLAAILIACAGGPGNTTTPPTPVPTTPITTATPDPSRQPTPSPGPGDSTVDSAAQAAALVFASDPRWSRMIPLLPDLIGQSSWYEAFEDATGFTVNITVGQGDCQAGCIERHTWQYHVDYAGTIELVGEDGDPITVPPVAGGDGEVQLNIQLTAGPTCPVEQFPPDPKCDARPVANAEVVIYDSAGNEIGRDTSDAAGAVQAILPAGAYFVVPSPVDGLMGTPDAQAFAAVGGDQVGLILAYDTGIR